MSTSDSSPAESTDSSSEANAGERAVARSTFESARRIGFYAAVVGTIGLFVLILGEFLLLPFTPLPPGVEAELAPHLFHDTVYSLMLWVALLGLVIQLYRPADKFVGVLGFTVLMVLLGASFAIPVANGTMPAEDLLLTATFAGLGIVIAVLHPSSGAILHPKMSDRISQLVLGLAVGAAVPLLFYIAREFLRQLSGVDPVQHVFAGHYGAMATVAGAILVLSLVAAVAPVGWRIAAVGAGLLAVIWGGSSILYPGLESSGGLLWGALAILWAIALVASTEFSNRDVVAADRTRPKAPKPA